MLTSSANQYLRPEYLTPLPTTVSISDDETEEFVDSYVNNNLTVTQCVGGLMLTEVTSTTT
jgi:hypothetical protein